MMKTQYRQRLVRTGIQGRRWIYMTLLLLGILAAASWKNESLRAQTAAATPAKGETMRKESAARTDAAVDITGLVRRPLHLSLRDLKSFGSVSVRRVDFRTNGYFGDFDSRGVPLVTLISMAGPQKQSSGFMRPTDLMIIVSNSSGRRALFSYGELLFRPPGDVVLALEAEPLVPKRSCDTCHENRSSHAWRETLNRKTVLPRLIAGRDFDADRSLEGVTGIEVAELLPSPVTPKTAGKPAPAQSVEIRDGDAILAVIHKLDSYPRHQVRALEVGDAMGYHGEVRCEGALLSDMLSAARAPVGPEIGYVVASKDGFRMSLSSAELFSVVQPPPIILADRCNGKPLGDQGAFKAIVAHDAIAERWVKSVASIHIVRAGNAK